MKRWVLVLLLAGFAYAAPAPSTLIANVSARNGLSLNGSWNVIVDPFDNGKWGFFRDTKPKDKQDLLEYSFDASPVMNVPGDWNTQRESLMFYEGPLWYRRLFIYHQHTGTRAFVYFGAANYRATVYLNGEKLGEHEGGFTAFNFECTPLLRDGENSLVIEVNNVRHADGVPGIKYDWWNYGGITRDVKLIEVPETFIQDYWIQLARGSQDQISGWVQLNGAQSGQKVSVDVPEAGVHLSAVTDHDGRVRVQASAKLELWSPEHPKLYDVVISVGG